jgi:hypothetical protein
MLRLLGRPLRGELTGEFRKPGHVVSAGVRCAEIERRVS